jgi:hypothetical protein
MKNKIKQTPLEAFMIKLAVQQYILDGIDTEVNIGKFTAMTSQIYDIWKEHMGGDFQIITEIENPFGIS